MWPQYMARINADMLQLRWRKVEPASYDSYEYNEYQKVPEHNDYLGFEVLTAVSYNGV
jgi:hypothetical protein